MEERAAPPPAPPSCAWRLVRLLVEYDGGGFKGSQLQAGEVRTIQGAIEQAAGLGCWGVSWGQAVCHLTHHPDPRELNYQAASRTDAGVHALGQAGGGLLRAERAQVAVLRVRCEQSAGQLQHQLNSRLPEDLVVRKVDFPEAEFNPRKAKRKWYQYQLHRGDTRSAVHRGYCWSVGKPLDLEALKAAASHMVGRHDFTSFCDPKAEGDSGSECDLESIEVQERGEMVLLDFRGNRFLYKMIRIIVGTLVEVARGKVQPEQINSILEAKDRQGAGPAAPGRGLTLMEVSYQ